MLIHLAERRRVRQAKLRAELVQVAGAVRRIAGADEPGIVERADDRDGLTGPVTSDAAELDLVEAVRVLDLRRREPDRRRAARRQGSGQRLGDREQAALFQRFEDR